tara:strand:- start:365 stop:592 length:228 start_codon:yes stop_codon:yes gene_type:complete
MSDKPFKAYEVSYHITNKVKVYAKTKEEAAELVRKMPDEILLDGSEFSIQHIAEPPARIKALEERRPDEFPLGSL